LAVANQPKPFVITVLRRFTGGSARRLAAILAQFLQGFAGLLWQRSGAV